MFNRVLIANRGEIACRIIHSCKRLGIHTIAIYSSADQHAQHAQLADEAWLLGDPTPAASYLNVEKILDIARRSHADAIHPGYGFLSENAEFVRAVEAAGICFIGPSAETMEQMGSKADAKRVMEAAGVPLVPGYHGNEQATERLQQEADAIGYPLMIKAAAGGGGKGMRIVRSSDDFQAALASCQRESSKAFADDKVILERYLENPRHIEFQIFGDQHGNIVHLFERDCSSQRRYQKVVEESPSPFLTDAMRQAMGQAAVQAAKAVNYCGAGTVEFIVAASGEFYFMEMNTRLQVEHPVTEMITALDLVEWQLEVAAGHDLPLLQAAIDRHGHAIEVRLYAETPSNNFLPSSGTIKQLRLPAESLSLRIDSGVIEGDEVTVHYDPMIAKLIVHAEDRDTALRKLDTALRKSAVLGIDSNIGFLQSLVNNPVLIQGEMHSAYLDRHLDEVLATQPTATPTVLIAAALNCLNAEEQSSDEATWQSEDWTSPWGIADGWRPGHPGKRVIRLDDGENLHEIHAFGYASDYQMILDGQNYQIRQAHNNGNQIEFILQDAPVKLYVYAAQDELRVVTALGRVNLQRISPLFTASQLESDSNQVIAPMPGQVVAVQCQSGDTVEKDQALLVMEAMKMELTLRAPRAGKVAGVHAQNGDFVEADSLLIELDDADG